MVQRTIAWYKQYRDILNSDIIHLRRADGRDSSRGAQLFGL